MLSVQTASSGSPGGERQEDQAPLRLQFGEDIEPIIRSRISYAFRVFAAVYGHPVTECNDPSGVEVFYGRKPPVASLSKGLWVPARYRAEIRGPAPGELAQRSFANERFFFFFGVDERTGNPDWLGEIFAWLSSTHERCVSERDAIGRIPFTQTVFAKANLSPRKPYAMMLMAWLQSQLVYGDRNESLSRAPSPAPDADHLVICSHDLDFYYTSRPSALLRLLKNLIIARRTYRSASFFEWNARQLVEVSRGKRVGDYFRPLCEASGESHFESTIFVVSQRHHRRDPNYHLRDLAPELRWCTEQGFSLALHGSYESINERSTLLPEVDSMKAVVGSRPMGSRQHWLRFGDHDGLFAAVEQAGLVYDSTLGFAEIAGFRNGACFAFPPYDFRHERPYPFLEIPLTLMDGSVEATARATGESAESIAREILHQSRKWGWGGIAVDWHNPIEPIQVPDEINRVFWKVLDEQKDHREKWISAEQFLRHCLNRYQRAGLLKDVRLDA